MKEIYDLLEFLRRINISCELGWLPKVDPDKD